VHPIVGHSGDAGVVDDPLSIVSPPTWAILEEPEDQYQYECMQEDSCEGGKALGRRDPRSQDAPDSLEGQRAGQQGKEEKEDNHLLLLSKFFSERNELLDL